LQRIFYLSVQQNSKPKRVTQQKMIRISQLASKFYKSRSQTPRI